MLLRGLLLFLFFSTFIVKAQTPADSINGKLSLDACVKYALAHEPAINQSLIDEQITEKNIWIKFADWLPQLGVNNTFQHYFKLPVSLFSLNGGPKMPIATGTRNNNTLQFSGTQLLYNNDVRLAARTASDYRLQSKQSTTETKINIVVNVSKAFYDVLLTEEQLAVLDEDIQRLRSNVKDAFSQYQSGVADKIDYKQAIIALNNGIAQRTATFQSIKGKYAFLKQLMGAETIKNFVVVYDSVKLKKELQADTLQKVSYANRIEYQLQETNLRLLAAELSYYRYGFLPTISAFGDYNLVYLNDRFSTLFDKKYPNSLFGATIAFPIFQGARRIQNVRKANLQLRRAELDAFDLKNQINTQYEQALGVYKGYIEDLQTNAQNIQIAKEVFSTVKLQYQEGIKTYLSVIQSESDLRTSELNYINAEFQVLIGKLDVQQALGTIAVNY